MCQAAATITGESPERDPRRLAAPLLRLLHEQAGRRRRTARARERDDPVFGAGYARVLNAGRPLLRAAQRSGEIRTDLTLEQILDMVAAVAKIPGDTRLPRADPARSAIDTLAGAKPGIGLAPAWAGRAAPGSSGAVAADALAIGDEGTARAARASNRPRQSDDTLLMTSATWIVALNLRARGTWRPQLGRG